MTAPIRLAIIGLGKIAHDQHVPAIARSSHFDLVATVDRAGSALDGVPSFASPTQLAESGIAVDAVSICTPPQVRHDIANAALVHGWDILLEKPPGATLAEIVALAEKAADSDRTLFAAWHSRYAPAVEPARAWLQDKRILHAKITWREDVRVWHPGQAWIWQPGGFGVFDPGINALSIVTHILPDPLFVVNSALSFPQNLAAPIAADLTLCDQAGVQVTANFDFREEGPQHWTIEVETDQGTLTLRDGGARMAIDGVDAGQGEDALHGEYPELYRRFAALVRARISEVDVAPLRLVADAFLCGKITLVEAFHE